jgi:hypothetical protein
MGHAMAVKVAEATLNPEADLVIEAFDCAFCGDAFEDAPKWRLHHTRKHRIDTRALNYHLYQPLRCGKCLWTTANSRQFWRHVRNVFCDMPEDE